MTHWVERSLQMKGRMIVLLVDNQHTKFQMNPFSSCGDIKFQSLQNPKNSKYCKYIASTTHWVERSPKMISRTIVLLDDNQHTKFQMNPFTSCGDIKFQSLKNPRNSKYCKYIASMTHWVERSLQMTGRMIVLLVDNQHTKFQMNPFTSCGDINFQSLKNPRNSKYCKYIASMTHWVERSLQMTGRTIVLLDDNQHTKFQMNPFISCGDIKFQSWKNLENQCIFILSI
jgi:predicted nucleic-acid-binding Zn-ribbon protein